MSEETKYNLDRFYVEGVGIFLDVLEDTKIGTIHACKLLNEFNQLLTELKAENERLQIRLNLTTKYKDDVKEDRAKYFDKVKELQQQLKEKDEEIEKLKNGLTKDEKFIEFYINSGKEQCDEINRINHNAMNYCEEIDKLNKQIIKNESEIKELKSENKLLKEANKNLYQRRVANTKQVCEKIRKYFDLNNLVDYTPADAFNKYKPAEITIYVKCLKEFLAQIEKGE